MNSFRSIPGWTPLRGGVGSRAGADLPSRSQGFAGQLLARGRIHRRFPGRDARMARGARALIRPHEAHVLDTDVVSFLFKADTRAQIYLPQLQDGNG